MRYWIRTGFRILVTLSVLFSFARAETEDSIELPEDSLTKLLSGDGLIGIKLQREGRAVNWILEPNGLLSENFQSSIETADGVKPDPFEVLLYKNVEKEDSKEFVRLSVIHMGKKEPQIRLYFSEEGTIHYAHSSPSAPRNLAVRSLTSEQIVKLVERSSFGRPSLQVEENPGDLPSKILLATEIDYKTTKFYSDQKSSANAEMLAVLNAVDGINAGKDAFSIVFQHSWAVSSLYSASTVKLLTEQFKNVWEDKFRPYIKYDAAILWSARSEDVEDSLGFTFGNSLDSEFSYAALMTDSLHRAAILQADQLSILAGKGRAEWTSKYPVLRKYTNALPSVKAATESAEQAGLKQAIKVAFFLFFACSLLYALRYRKRVRLVLLPDKVVDSGRRKAVSLKDILEESSETAKENLAQEEPTFEEKMSMAGILDQSGRRRTKFIHTFLPAISATLLGLSFLVLEASPYLIYGGMIVLILSVLLPKRRLEGRIIKRREEIIAVLPNFVEQISICLSGSLDIWASIEFTMNTNLARDTPSAITSVIVRASQLVRTGVGIEECLVLSARETGVPELVNVFRFLAQCKTHGGEIRKQVQNLAESVLLHHQIQVEKQIKALPVKATFPLFMVFAGFFGILFAGLATKMMQSF